MGDVIDADATFVSRVPRASSSVAPRQGDHQPGSVRLRGASVAINVPKRGPKAQLMDTVTDAPGADHHRTRRAGDITRPLKALEQLDGKPGPPGRPLRIECYDVSRTPGKSGRLHGEVFERHALSAYPHLYQHSRDGW